jgi:sugar phosphate isomerase/epimerase
VHISKSNQRVISLAHLSLIESEPAQFIGIASRVGFDHVDLRLSPATATDRVYTPQQRVRLCRELQPILQDSGMRIWDVEIVRINDLTQVEDHLPLLEAAALLGARRVKVVSDSDEPSLIASKLAGLCERSAPLGLTIDLEYMVFSGVKSLRAALQILHAARQPNLKVLVDALHWRRAGDTLAQIAAARQNLGYLQVCDGPLEAPIGRELLIQEARTRRLPPGEGQFPLRSLLGAMPVQCALSVEVPLLPGLDPQAHAQQLLQATRATIAGQNYEASP